MARMVVENFAQDNGCAVVEIGAGTGALTQALLDAGLRVTALEIDSRLIDILQSRDELRAAKFVHADALNFDYGTLARDETWAVAGNLPYNIATPLISKFARMARRPSSLVVMVQKDVAERFLASPGTTAYGSLTVAVNYWFKIARGFLLRPAAFYPRPKVDSAVIRLTRHPTPPVMTRDVDFMLQVSRAAFAYRRKTLVNSLVLALGLNRERIQEALLATGLHTEIRGEQLSLAQFAALADRMAG
ncbi:MAG: 16S rRNA (adenine(1518)-N(6)/adenine(1519)-N(6))-dimethyltransferase RsmA [Candidatus Eremiobacteraeota bacterium]|nr:16S rRNA (adenine(1518)-N(6)/adenine(1519)-N(6))-dimethyltransferase RsmA [Candidatus Eremiobacteraeota bacterium]